jgi:RNA polymerase sigma factor (sigma-70 family)
VSVLAVASAEHLIGKKDDPRDRGEEPEGSADQITAERLRRLQEHGVIESQEAPPPARATVYTLTARGRGFAPALTALVTWGAPLMVSQGDDAFRTRWLVRGLPVLFAGVDVADLVPLEVVVRTGDEPATLTIGPDGVDMRIGASSSLAAVTVQGPPDQVLALLTGSNSRLRESLSMAFLVLLERLSPAERAVFLLREVFDHEYSEIAAALDLTESNCRQILRRAKTTDPRGSAAVPSVSARTR